MQEIYLDSKQIEKARRRCIKKFLFYFKKGFSDFKYLSWEREYKWNAYVQFQELLNKEMYSKLLKQAQYERISEIAIRIESKTNLLFSFEKMALRDAVKGEGGAELFAFGLFDFIYGKQSLEKRFKNFVEVVGQLPRKQTRVLTWPLVTVFGFIGNPKEHIYLKPRVTKQAAFKYKFPFDYQPKPNWQTYTSLLSFAEQIKNDTEIHQPKDYIDLQSFIWVVGSDEYPD